MLLIVFGAILIGYTIFVIYRERFVFFNKNRLLIDMITKITDAYNYNNVWVTLSVNKLSANGFYAKIWFIKNEIILIEDYSLDLNKNAKKYVNTYLIKKKKSPINLDKKLFRNLSLLNDLEISDDGKVVLKTDNYEQSAFEAIGFYPTSFELNISLSLPIKKEQVENIFEQMQLNTVT